MTYERAATDLTERIEALATALHAAGVSPEHSADLLAAAAKAAAHALTLHARLADAEPPLPVAA